MLLPLLFLRVSSFFLNTYFSYVQYSAIPASSFSHIKQLREPKKNDMKLQYSFMVYSLKTFFEFPFKTSSMPTCSLVSRYRVATGKKRKGEQAATI
ncbi:hypothetical protein [Methanosarcina horonobensis]|uniref:hypothetical protein n=1 Tax=Methanosarcina horonobensis TaxID=418008 RepID=UPI0022B92C6A|nr:hypothetical protein [Methanosarcina horonobensis]